MQEQVWTYAIGAFLVLVTVTPYVVRLRRRERVAQQQMASLKVSGLQSAPTMHPHIDALACIGCGGCVAACPEGDVLAVLDGKATLVHGAHCVGHGLCADACPIGAITMLMAAPGKSANLPILTESLETTVPNLFIAGELGGIGLIKNAVQQGKGVVETIARRAAEHAGRGKDAEFDLVIVGAGPAGLSAALTAKALGLKAVVLEQGATGGTLLHYPRRKIVLTSPVDLPLWGRLRFTEASKESLLALWTKIARETALDIRTGEKVTDLHQEGGVFQVVTPARMYTALHVVLALGRRGTPRKLDVPGEDLPKVMYALQDAETYRDSHLLVVGGGDSALEAALGLSIQRGNTVTLSYRQAEFSRAKKRNMDRLEEAVRSGRIRLLLRSAVLEISHDAVRLDNAGTSLQLTNDYVFVCAGGDLPFDFLGRIGVELHQQVVA